MNSTLNLLGHPPISRDTYQAQHCVPVPDFYARVIGRPLTGPQWATAEEEFVRFLSRRPVRLRNEAKPLLAGLRDLGCTQSLLSLLPHDRLLEETAQAGVQDYFARIDGRRHPHVPKAQALATHLDALALQPAGHHNVLLIGDTTDDAVAARSAGARVLLVTGGLETVTSLLQSGADVADTLDHAVAIGLRDWPPPTPAEPPAPTYTLGDGLLALTDQLNGTDSYADAAALLHRILEPTHGLLERLGEFFEAAGEKAKEAEQDDGFDLSYDLADAAAEVRNLTEVLHVAEDRMRALTPLAPAPRRPSAPGRAPSPPPPHLPPTLPRPSR